MTNEEAIQIIEVAQAECEWNAPLEYQEAFKVAISALGAIDQYRWERDIAVEQLKELGYELGEKIRTDDKNSSQELKNSNDCISRKSLLDKCRPLAEPEDDFDDEYYSGYSCGAGAVVSLIEKEPSISPTQMSGKWLIRKFGADAQCSICGMRFSDVYDLENSDAYCRHCGAKMEGLKVMKNG